MVWVAVSLAVASALPLDQEDEAEAIDVEVDDDTDLAQMLQDFFISKLSIIELIKLPNSLFFLSKLGVKKGLLILNYLTLHSSDNLP